MKALIVDDDLALADVISFTFRRAGFDVSVAYDGHTAIERWQNDSPDIVILDLNLPKLDGLSVCRQIRTQSDVPIIILTVRGEEDDIVKGLELGADDYVVKPFQLEEIVARLNALLRRAAGFAKPKLEFGSLSLDIAAKRLLVDEQNVDLTAYEYKMLEYLMLHPGQVISKTELTEHLYAQDYDRDSNVLEVFVRRLRQKLDPEQTLKPIETVRGQGYRFNLEES